MIFKIAFRNIWRSRTRSWVLMSAIAMGIWGGLTVIGLAKGLTQMRQEKAIETYLSHLQIHHPDYMKYGRETDRITEDLSPVLNQRPHISAASKRAKLETFVQSPYSSSAVVLNGVDPAAELQVNQWETYSQEGNFLREFKRKKPIVLGSKLAERLSVKVNSSLQCSFVDANGDQRTAVFKVVDVFTTSNSMFDEINAFVRWEDMEVWLGALQAHEYALRLSSDEHLDEEQQSLAERLPAYQVDSWRELAPELGLADAMMDLVMLLFLVIIMFALSFGIVNTMLMAVLERKKELGMLLSVGMNKKRLFRMIALESILLALISAPIGIGLTLLSNSILEQHGIDLSFLSDGLRSVGLGSTLYPELADRYYLIVTVLVVLTAVLSCLYPAYKALKLNPVETIRTAE